MLFKKGKQGRFAFFDGKNARVVLLFEKRESKGGFAFRKKDAKVVLLLRVFRSILHLDFSLLFLARASGFFTTISGARNVIQNVRKPDLTGKGKKKKGK